MGSGLVVSGLGPTGYGRKGRNRVPGWVPDIRCRRQSNEVVVPHFRLVNGDTESQIG